jgi:hypothetical protein
VNVMEVLSAPRDSSSIGNWTFPKPWGTPVWCMFDCEMHLRTIDSGEQLKFRFGTKVVIACVSSR